MARTKKEIDKELMYKKIMPSAARASAQDDDEDDEAPAPKATARTAKSAQPQERFAGAQLDKIAAGVRKKVAELAEEPPPKPLEFRTPAPYSPPSQSASERRYALPPLLGLDAAPTAPDEPDDSGSEPPPEKLLINQMELLVDGRIGAVIEKFRCCSCEKCRKDIIAIALNKLKPHYVVLDEQAPEPTADRQKTAEVTTALIQAVLIVKAHPRH